MKPGIFKIEVALAHSALHIRDRVTHHAAQAGLRLGAMHNLLDRGVHQSAVEDRWIVASTAPLGGFCADRVLHVLDRLSVPLIVEGREVVGRTGPLGKNVLVAALAGI